MTLPALLLLAVALAMDAFAVSIAVAIRLGSFRAGPTLRLALAFGFFQFLMPVIGWALGLTVRGAIERWDHWAAFGLLAFIGVNMLREAFGKGEEHGAERGDPTRGFSLLVLAVATSIDALAVGLSFALLGIPVWLPAGVIGVVCAAITTLGVLLGVRLSHAAVVSKRAELVGGLVLIGIGLKILYEHGVF